MCISVVPPLPVWRLCATGVPRGTPLEKQAEDGQYCLALPRGAPLEGSGAPLEGSGAPLDGSGAPLEGSGATLEGSGAPLESTILENAHPPPCVTCHLSRDTCYFCLFNNFSFFQRGGSSLWSAGPDN